MEPGYGLQMANPRHKTDARMRNRRNVNFPRDIPRLPLVDMANTSSLVFAGIAPHPPIMVPEVGREAIAGVRSSIDAMAALTERVIGSGSETVILISPHAPLEPDAFVAYDGPQLHA